MSQRHALGPKVSRAVILETTHRDPEDRMPDEPCYYATCLVSGMEAGPVWGDDQAAKDQVLERLSEECSCGAASHEEDYQR